MNSGLKLWERSKKVIPGGNGLLSKRPERYAPDLWPTYYSKARGVEVWDLDGNVYVDMAQMGLGAAILGYSNKELNDSVNQAIANGVATTLNAPEEVELAEKLVSLNPFAGGVKFARTGGEAMSIAVRIARAFAGRDKIAISGYHGWCDWYIAANLTGENKLSEHLLPGLDPKGIPSGLVNTVIPFRYNDVEDFKSVMRANPDVGVIVIEGARYDFPTADFLSTIQTVAKENNVIIVSDEITSGWRMTDGGIYKLNGFEPDIVVYGKAMGGGFAISAVVGRQEIMNEAQNTFISSTFWTERVGFVAALKTIEILTRDRVWERLISLGNRIGNGWIELAQKHNIKLNVTDFKPLITMKFEYDQLNNSLTTLFTQEMLKKGYLAATSIYLSAAHSEDIIDSYMEKVDEVFGFMSKVIRSNTVLDSLETDIKQDAFKRLN
ncbi:MAG: aminotransferase class III-fold pyridoxal phosphate-dependent enzyme [Bacteroidetes bacterium]|nr:aminotransferase class III-fold pyridoxal phosphate-dependent enzyme [Bacteroidota bacterium]